VLETLPEVEADVPPAAAEPADLEVEPPQPEPEPPAEVEDFEAEPVQEPAAEPVAVEELPVEAFVPFFPEPEPVPPPELATVPPEPSAEAIEAAAAEPEPEPETVVMASEPEPVEAEAALPEPEPEPVPEVVEPEPQPAFEEQAAEPAMPEPEPVASAQATVPPPVSDVKATMLRWPTNPGLQENGQTDSGEPATSIIPAWQPADIPSESRRTVSLSAMSPEAIAAGETFAAKLSFETGPFAGRVVALPNEMVTVGRAPDNDVVVSDPATSGRHGRIEMRAGAFWISDLGSTNGTLVNGEPVIERQLSDGDLIAIGQNTMRFTLSE
jgi:hypothetical protein